MKNVCSECGKDARVLYPGKLCPTCYGEKVPSNSERERAWKVFMKKSSNVVIGGGKRDSGVVGE